MAILNTNEVVLEDSGLPLESTVVIGHHFNGVSKIGIAEISMQVGFYASVEKWQANSTNRLKVVGFGEDKRIVKFDYPVDAEEDIFYFFDLQLKAYLLQIFPEWDESKLSITTAPEEPVE